MNSTLHTQLPSSSEPSQLVRYDAMCNAIIAAYEIDEVKEIRDRAIALQAYMRQLKDHDNEDRCAKIRIRAERRAVEIYDQGMKAKGASGPGRGKAGRSAGGAFNDAQTLADHDVTSQQMARWRKLTEIPEKQFQAEVERQQMPTVESVYYTVFPPPKPTPVSAEALWLWGRLRDFERDPHYPLDRDPSEFFPTMTEHMLADVVRLLPYILAWLEQARDLCRSQNPDLFSTSSPELSTPAAKHQKSAQPG